MSSIATGVGGSVVASAAFSGSVVATQEIDHESKEQLKDVADEYSSARAIREAVETHAQDLLEELSNRELLESGTADNLPIKSSLSKEAFPHASEGTLVVGLLVENKPTAHIMIKKSLGTQELAIIVEPHIGRSFATVSGADIDSSETDLIRTDVGTTASCTCYTGEACIVTCSATTCSCRNYYVECCPDCCECNIGEQVAGGCSDCFSDCWEATSCDCT